MSITRTRLHTHTRTLYELTITMGHILKYGGKWHFQHRCWKWWFVKPILIHIRTSVLSTCVYLECVITQLALAQAEDEQFCQWPLEAGWSTPLSSRLQPAHNIPKHRFGCQLFPWLKPLLKTDVSGKKNVPKPPFKNVFEANVKTGVSRQTSVIFCWE